MTGPGRIGGLLLGRRGPAAPLPSGERSWRSRAGKEPERGSEGRGDGGEGIAEPWARDFFGPFRPTNESGKKSRHRLHCSSAGRAYPPIWKVCRGGARNGGSGPLSGLWQDRSQGGRGLSSGLSVPCRPRTFSEPGGLLSRQPSTAPPFVPAQDSSFGAPTTMGGRPRKGAEEAGRRRGHASLSLSSPILSPLPHGLSPGVLFPPCGFSGDFVEESGTIGDRGDRVPNRPFPVPLCE